ncbi:MAG: glutamate 5-kinase [Tatlockia sp.]|nr:glutamate 5-kinase [Tatlockia sp.]
MNIVIKVGTQSILTSDGSPVKSILTFLVEQIYDLKESGHNVILVSSGAVASGRKVANDKVQKLNFNSVGGKQLLASLGQPKLMHIYSNLFKTRKILVSQLLLTKQDFLTRQHYLNIARLLHELLKHTNIVPIINENDSVAIEELMFTDNDELAGLIAAQINADRLIILTNVDGVYTGHPDEAGSKLITVIDPNERWPTISTSKSALGRGGMFSKLHTARKMAGLGINTTIANINQPKSIMDIINRKNIGTTILAKKKQSNIKRWIAYHADKKLGSIIINNNLMSLLRETNRILSILPIGIEKSAGEFQKGDLIDIYSLNNDRIGVGIAKYDSKKLVENLGEKDKPAFIHYDQLHIF